MRILMMSNTYDPVVGGLERSIRSFSEELRGQGRRVVVVAPEFEGMVADETDVVRVPAIKKFLRNDISLTLPIPLFVSHFVKDFQPDIIHSHHFFGVGDMALRLSRQHHVPLVFTHHIMLEQYADFFPIHTDGVKRFVLKLAAGYANLTDGVIAPSQAVYDILKAADVMKPLHIVPTGIDADRFTGGDGREFRKQWNIPQDAFVIGCVCRLNPEKNLEFLAGAASRFLRANPRAYCLFIGDGPLKETIKNIFRESRVEDRLRCPGVLKGPAVICAYHAMDVFIFSSRSETQGLVLLEAMASGTPVVALDAPAVREIVRDHKNGRLIFGEDESAFAVALQEFFRLDDAGREELKEAARATAREFSIGRCTKRLLDIYEGLMAKGLSTEKKGKIWDSVRDNLKAEKELLSNALKAGEAFLKKRR